MLRQLASHTDQERPEHEEFAMLMSMALDARLDSREERRLARHLQGCAPCQHQWSIWQALDRHFRAAPMAVPAADFVERFQDRLQRREQRHRLRVAVFLTSVALVVWMVGLVGIALLLGLFVYSSIGALAETLNGFAAAWTALAVVARSLWGVLVGLADNPTAQSVFTLYLLVFPVALAGWFQFLRRSLHPVTE